MNGRIHGRPEREGIYYLAFEVHDALGRTMKANQSIELRVLRFQQDILKLIKIPKLSIRENDSSFHFIARLPRVSLEKNETQ